MIIEIYGRQITVRRHVIKYLIWMTMTQDGKDERRVKQYIRRG